MRISEFSEGGREERADRKEWVDEVSIISLSGFTYKLKNAIYKCIT